MTSAPTPDVISDLLAGTFAEYDPDDHAPFGFHVYKAALGPETIVELRGVDLLPFNPGEGPRALLGGYAAAIRAAGYPVRETGSVVVVPACPPSEVHDMILRWGDVHAGDLALADGELQLVTDAYLHWRPGHGEQVHVEFDGFPDPWFMDPDELTAVKRYDLEN